MSVSTPISVPSSLRILLVASRLEWEGGVGRVVRGAALALAARGHSVRVAGSGTGLASFPESVGLHAWPPRKLKIRNLGRLVSLVRTFRPHVVHFHSTEPHGELIAGLRLLAPPSDRPALIVTPHTPEGRYAKRRSRWGLRVASRIACPCHWSAGSAIRAGARRDAVSVVYNGVTPHEPVETERRPMVAGLASLSRRKGMDVLITAFERAAAARQEWGLTIAGSGSALRDLERQAAKTCCAGRIEFAGRVAGEAKRRLLSEASIGAVPSRDDCFPGVVQEFQAAGVPVIASDVGGIPEQARGGAAILVPPDDPAALAERLARLMDDPQARADLAGAGRERAASLSWEAMAVRLEEVYREARADRRARIGSGS